MKKIIFAIAIILACASSGYLQAQGSSEYGAGMKLNVNSEGTKYVRFITWSQIWMRSVQNNPGTLVNGVSQNNTFDIGARRLRMLVQAQMSPRFMVLAHFGINNQTFLNGGAPGTSGTGGYGQGKKPELFFHDFWGEYVIIPALNAETKKANPFSMSFGAGLHYYLGLSRMTMHSTLNFMAVDSPVFTWATIENSDQFARMFGVFLKGKANKFEYRLSLNKPFATNLTPVEGVAVDNNGVSKASTSGYCEYQFFDQESNVLPFKVGSYVGTKRVFNIGAGFYHQPQGTQSLKNGVVQKHNISLMSVDAFLDMPIGKKEKNTALTLYSGIYKYNFGPNYIRNAGIMNTGTLDPKFEGQKALAGAGNARPLLGTGTMFYTQAGVLLPKSSEKPKVRIQPFGAYTWKKLEALSKSGNYYDVGTNFYLEGHHSKITLQYSTRPIYLAKDKIDGSKGEFIIQFQTYL
ncbi:hypothetical protein [Runella zeae]|uniref:hypothetical protein n=1 Tax=Runella zeae TaxID=94255 RepID=UPI00048D8B5B|nr:hypothetical protein [Runella zeae]